MTAKPPIFIELCAGTAALSLRLQGGPKAKPPVSRMGAKTGYADAILAVLGLYPGQGAESYLWCEPDDGVRGLLMAYPQPDVLRAAAAILRGWKDEEPRALWERLRAELKAGAAVEGAEGVAKWAYVTTRTMPQANARGATAGDFLPRVAPSGVTRYQPDAPADGLESIPSLPPTFIARDGRAVTPEEVAKFCTVTAWTNNGGNMYAGPDRPSSCHPPGWTAAITASGLASRIADLPPFPPVTIVSDGRVVTPEEVARFAFVSARTMPQSSGRGEIRAGDFLQRIKADGTQRYPADHPADVLDGLPPFPPVTIAADARDLTPPKLPPGVVCYMDPPYLDTTGYKHDLPRSEVVRMARLWADAGATVCISEAEAIPELMADGWHAVEISATRRGAKRTFSKQQAEWLTLSRPPSFVPRETVALVEVPVVEVVKPVRVKAAPVIVEPQEPQEDRQVDLFGGDR